MRGLNLGRWYTTLSAWRLRGIYEVTTYWINPRVICGSREARGRTRMSTLRHSSVTERNASSNVGTTIP